MTKHQAFYVRNASGTFAATIWAKNADEAGSIGFALAPRSRSMSINQINGHAR